MQSYSQSGEDLVLYDRYLGQLFPAGGVYFEAGAMDGIRYSNTKFLHEFHGWSGVLVEPHPVNFEKLTANRPADYCLDFLISDVPGQLEFTYFTNENLAAVSGVASTFTPNLLKTFYQSTEPWMQDQVANSLETRMVETRTLDEILASSGVDRINFASLDLEGHELAALQSYTGAVPIDLLLVEMNDLRLDQRLAELGFVQIERLAQNWLYASRDLADQPLLKARRLQHSFREARKQLPDPDQNGLIETSEIWSVVESGDPATETWPPLVARSTAIESSFAAFGAVNRTSAQGKPSHHFLFRKNERFAEQCTGFILRDALLSYDITAPDRPEFYVFDNNSHLVNGLCFGARPFVLDAGQHFDQAAFIDDMFPPPNISHFVLDKLPRAVRVLDEADISCGLVFHTQEYASAIASLLGIKIKGLATTATRGTAAVGRLAVVSNSFHGTKHPLHAGERFHVEYLNRLRSASLSLKRPRLRRRSPKRIFVHRQHESRRVANFAELAGTLTNLGVTPVDPGAMSPVDQVLLFRDASLVIGPHGAGLTNVLFMDPGSLVIELLPQLSASRAYGDLCHLAGLHYRYQVAADPDFGRLDPGQLEHDTRHNRRDIVVDCDHLAMLVQGTAGSH